MLRPPSWSRAFAIVIVPLAAAALYVLCYVSAHPANARASTTLQPAAVPVTTSRATRADLSVVALIGVILLMGIVKKNGIMMVDVALQAEREQQLAPEQAIRHACLLRFRPIMMTTLAALLGALPLMLGNGTGLELRRPLGYALVGGLLVSQMLTLFTTPVIYLYLDRFARRASRDVSRRETFARAQA